MYCKQRTVPHTVLPPLRSCHPLMQFPHLVSHRSLCEVEVCFGHMMFWDRVTVLGWKGLWITYPNSVVHSPVVTAAVCVEVSALVLVIAWRRQQVGS